MCEELLDFWILSIWQFVYGGKISNVSISRQMLPWYLIASYIQCISKSYSYRCGHCKRLKPEFQKAASVLAANDPPVTLAQVDCTDVGKDTCGRFEVSGYPTVKIFRNGELSSDYSGPREAGGIVKYMKAQVGPASKDCKSKDDLDKLLAKPEVVVVCYSKDAQDVFMKVANAMRETVAFGHTEAGDKEGIVLHRPKVSLFLNPNLFAIKLLVLY